MASPQELLGRKAQVSFKPDYGLQLTNTGIGRDVDHFFYNFRLYSVSVLDNGRYSTFVNFPSDGKYALSLDFNQQQLEQILAAAPPEIANLLRSKLSQDPSSCRSIDFPGEVTFAVRARPGTAQTTGRESFVPFIAQEIL
jgi:hypothetical protein